MAPKKRGLGRGLNTLLGEDIKITEEPSKAGSIIDLEMEKIQAGQYQPRNKMAEEKLRELADSIREQGVINPIVVRAIGSEKYEIIAGERRFRACNLAGKKTIPAIVRSVDDKDALAMALIENMQREDLNAIEESLGIKRLITEFGYTHEQAAAAVGKSRSATTNLLRLLTLSEPVQRLMMDEQLEMGHARALLPLSGAEQIQLASEIIAKQLSVRETERLVNHLKSGKEKKIKQKQSKKSRDDLILENRLSEALGATVHVDVARGGKGKVTIDFASLDDLDALVEKLAPEDGQT